MATLQRSSQVRSRRRSRERGFSLFIVVILVALVIAAAATMMWTTQGGLAVTGISREQALALNGAEYAVAQAKALIASQSPAAYSSTTGWTPLLTSTVPAVTNMFCSNAAGTLPATSAVPGTVPKAANTLQNLFVDTGGTQMVGAPVVQWRYCIHNNSEDPHYLDPAGNTPANVANGEINDQRDPQHLLVIEGFANAPNGASARVTVTVGAPTLSTLVAGGNAYSQEGGTAAHGGAAGASESGIGVGTGSVTF